MVVHCAAEASIIQYSADSPLCFAWVVGPGIFIKLYSRVLDCVDEKEKACTFRLVVYTCPPFVCRANDAGEPIRGPALPQR